MQYQDPDKILKGQVYFADLPTDLGHIQSGKRPVVIVQNNIGNEFSQTVIVATLTTQMKKIHQPTHVIINGVPPLIKNGQVLCEQLYTLNKDQLVTYIGELKPVDILRVDLALKISLGLVPNQL